MNKIRVFIESGKRKTFAGAVEWPGWCRSGRNENKAFQTLIDYGPRYAQVMQLQKIEFIPPVDTSGLWVVERNTGNASTDFGTPAMAFHFDAEPVDSREYAFWQAMLPACWQAFDATIIKATGCELRRGPRGGGRDLQAIIAHVLEADHAYLRRLAWKHPKTAERNLLIELKQTRQSLLDALEVAVGGDLPAHGPHGGLIWSPRYFVRRVAWHVLDHMWEIEDRIEGCGPPC